jgi:ribonuclease T2
MRMSRFAVRIPGLMAAVCAVAAQAAEPREEPHYYTLSISLAPALCQLHPENRQLRVCQEGYSVMVQGFWPEHEDGRKLRNCSKDSPDLSPVQERVLEKVMPDDPVRVREWQRHGSCTGMSAREYFRALMASANRLRLPQLISKEGRDQVVERNQLVAEIMKINAGLPEKGIYLRCSQDGANPTLTELRVCYKPGGQFTECVTSFRPNCPSSVVIRAVP